MKGLIALVAVMTATSAQAQDGAELWGGLRVGMSKEAVAAAIPKLRNYPLGGGCHGHVKPQYSSGKLNRVLIDWGDRDDITVKCRDYVLSALTKKYGEPVLDAAPPVCSSPLFAGRRECLAGKRTWKAGGLQVVAVTDQRFDFAYNLAYSRADEPDTSDAKL